MRISNETYKKLLNNSITVKQSKYKNKKAKYKNIEFDSMKEMSWYIKYELMEKSGSIKDLQRQVKFELQPSFKLNGKTIRAINYYADITYIGKDNKLHVIDIKGMRTEVYKLKKKMMAYKYNIEIEEI